MTPRRLDYIDALRGFAVTGVIASHLRPLFPDLHWRLGKILELGAHGVQLFFVASALTLMLSWHSRNDGPLPFYLRRLFRIAPMFWLATALYGGMHVAGMWPDGGSTPFGIATTLFFLHGWSPETINLVVPGGWTIGVEMTFYAIFPAIAVAIATLPRAIAFVVGSALFAIGANTEALRLLAATDPHLLGSFVYYWFPNSLQVFAWGCLTFHLLHIAPTSKLWSAVLLAGTGLLAMYCAWWPVAWFPTWTDPLSRALLTGAASLLLALALAASDMSWLTNRVSCFVGRVSFSAYLVHFLVVAPIAFYRGTFHVGSWWSPPLFVAVLVAVLSVTLWISSLTYRFIERPCIQAGSRFVRRWALPS